MGMDVFGLNPITTDGELFRINVWGWRPIADYCIETAPEIARRCKHWHTNDGKGLNQEDSTALADALQAEIDGGRIATYARLRESKLALLQNQPCFICEGTGKRKPIPEPGAGDAIIRSPRQ